MKAAQKKPSEAMRMSGAEFDRIMGRALQVKAEKHEPTKAKKAHRASKKNLKTATPRIRNSS
jgi:hypothetical protein